jgi:DNA-binding NarL/FixJ family response regulator
MLKQKNQALMLNTIRVLLADDHPLVRTGIGTVLKVEDDLVVVGEATNGYEARRLCESLAPDVLLFDLNMPGPPPVETVEFLKKHCPRIKILVLTAYDDDAFVCSLVAAGVTGYVLKDEATQVIVQAIRAVIQGGSWFSRSVLEKLAQANGGKMRIPLLTFRERQILAFIAQGWNNTRIAMQMGLAEQTIRNYASRLYIKLGVQSRAEAIIWSREHYQVGNTR